MSIEPIMRRRCEATAILAESNWRRTGGTEIALMFASLSIWPCVEEFAMANNSKFPESDPRHHTSNIKDMLDDLITHLRDDVDKIDEPKAQAMFETTAEILSGAKTAFEHYEAGTEAAFAVDPCRKFKGELAVIGEHEARNIDDHIRNESCITVTRLRKNSIMNVKLRAPAQDGMKPRRPEGRMRRSRDQIRKQQRRRQTPKGNGEVDQRRQMGARSS